MQQEDLTEKYEVLPKRNLKHTKKPQNSYFQSRTYFSALKRTIMFS